jgi:multicomponent Na+:H+ antiporter subunit E
VKRVVWLLGLVVVWVLAWGSLSVANVLGGLAVGALLLWIAPDSVGGGRVRVRPVALARFAGYVLFEM